MPSESKPLGNHGIISKWSPWIFMTHSSSGPGYDKALYYPISEESGGKVLHDIRSRLEAVVPRYLSQSFIPHITAAEIYNGEPQGTAWSFEELLRQSLPNWHSMTATLY